MTFPFPFAMPPGGMPPAVELSRTAGVNIFMNFGPSGAPGTAAFDGNTNQSSGQAASTDSFLVVGKSYGVPTALDRVRVFGSNNAGFCATATGTVTLYGKNGSSPSGRNDGVPLGFINVPQGGNESGGRDIISSDKNTFWDHFWVLLERDGGGYIFVYLAELQMWGWQ